MNEAGINELRAQRNNALDMLVNANAALADALEELARTQAEIAAMKSSDCNGMKFKISQGST
jgi:hypothetical protein